MVDNCFIAMTINVNGSIFVEKMISELRLAQEFHAHANQGLVSVGDWGSPTQSAVFEIFQLNLIFKHCRKPHCCNGIVDTFGQD